MSVNVGNEICVAGSAQQQQPVKKRVYDECAPEIRRITEVRANKKRASQYSQAGHDDSTAISRSSFNSSSPSILSLMSSDDFAQQLERSALRLADSMKRSEESRVGFSKWNKLAIQTMLLTNKVVAGPVAHLNCPLKYDLELPPM
uniref:Uncharacterized protein n=1 Tax=Chaetoceros debilis TaxID=122233 RepID=A0A7S3Q2B3_9STRA